MDVLAEAGLNLQNVRAADTADGGQMLHTDKVTEALPGRCKKGTQLLFDAAARIPNASKKLREHEKSCRKCRIGSTKL